jgi:HK97 family phage major capsid protein
VSLRAGALTLPMDARELAIARIVADPVPMWRPEGSSVTGTTMSFDRVTLRAKTLAAIVPVSIELLEDAANAGQIIQSSLQQAMGLALDKAALMGSGAETEPLGIKNQAGVNAIAAVGALTDYSKLTAAVGKAYAANYPGDPGGLSCVMNPREGETFDSLEDTTGQPLQPTPWAAALKKFATTSLPITEGGGGNESSMIVGDFSQVVIGMRTSGAMVRILESGTVTDSDNQVHEAASQLKKLIVAYLRADVVLLRPSWMTVLSGITP